MSARPRDARRPAADRERVCYRAALSARQTRRSAERARRSRSLASAGAQLCYRDCVFRCVLSSAHMLVTAGDRLTPHWCCVPHVAPRLCHASQSRRSVHERSHELCTGSLEHALQPLHANWQSAGQNVYERLKAMLQCHRGACLLVQTSRVSRGIEAAALGAAFARNCLPRGVSRRRQCSHAASALACMRDVALAVLSGHEAVVKSRAGPGRSAVRSAHRRHRCAICVRAGLQCQGGACPRGTRQSRHTPVP